MKFTKMQGLGNDYVYVNCFEEKIENPPAVARYVSDRHFGIGSDGLIMINPSEVADLRWRCITQTVPAVRCVEMESGVWQNMSMITDLRIRHRSL